MLFNVILSDLYLNNKNSEVMKVESSMVSDQTKAQIC